MTRYANTLLKRSEEFVSLFGLSKPAQTDGNNEPRVFPYGKEGTQLYQEFINVLDTYENYLEFVQHYKDLVFSLEEDIKDLRCKLNRLTFTGDPLFERPDIQSTAKLLGNMAHKLYYIRTNARTWRREINELLRDEAVA